MDSPQDREAAGRATVEAVGGALHQFFFAFGSEDTVAIVELPDDQAMAACSLAMGASGTFSGGSTTKLMTSQKYKSAV